MSGTPATAPSVITLPVGAPVSHFGGRAAPQGAMIVKTGADLNRAIDELATQVASWIAGISGKYSQPVVLAPVLTGGAFVADAVFNKLRREGVYNIQKAPFTVSTRDGDGCSLAQPTVTLKEGDYAGRHVLVMDDVFDSGATLEIARKALGGLATSVKALVLCEKSGVAQPSIARPDFVGITLDPTVSKLWLSGGGMDMPGCSAGEPDRARQERCIIGYPPISEEDTGFELKTTPLPSGR